MLPSLTQDELLTLNAYLFTSTEQIRCLKNILLSYQQDHKKNYIRLF